MSHFVVKMSAPSHHQLTIFPNIELNNSSSTWIPKITIPENFHQAVFQNSTKWHLWSFSQCLRFVKHIFPDRFFCCLQRIFITSLQMRRNLKFKFFIFSLKHCVVRYDENIKIANVTNAYAASKYSRWKSVKNLLILSLH